MGCCGPNFRKAVSEQEEQLNKNGKDDLPLFAKALIVIVGAGGLLAAAFLI